jgi:DtxR family Mn-dependent transcriptional regulator
LKTKLSSQMEDYLEAICQLCQEEGVARVRDIAARLEVTNSSVVGAIKNLKGRGLVSQERYGYVRLTGRGEELAESLIHRHQVLSNFLEKILGLDHETASRDACKIEHAVSAETVRRLRAVAEFIESKAHDDLDWPREFKRFYRKCGGKN